MHFDCLVHPLFRFFNGLSGRNTAGKIRGKGRVIISRFFYHQEISFHGNIPSCMPVKLVDIHASQPEHPSQGSRFQLVMEWNNRSRLSISSCF